MKHSFELTKKNWLYTLKIIQHYPPGQNDHHIRFELAPEELEELKALLCPKVISYDMKDFEKRLMNLESRYDAEVSGLIDEQNILSHHLVEVDNVLDGVTTDVALIKFFTKNHLEKAHEPNRQVQADQQGTDCGQKDGH